MNSTDRIAHDLRDLATRSGERIPSPDETALSLRAALDRRSRRSGVRSLRRPLLATAGGLAVAAGVLLCPVPYSHQVGWDATLRAADGHVATLHLRQGTAAQAQRRAAALAGPRGASVTLTPRTELVWGSVYAMAREKLLNIDVQMQGKTDADVEAEIRGQLAQQGWTPGDVLVERSGSGSTVGLGADDGEGRHVQLLRKTDGADADRVQIELAPIDDAREPGMTDDQLREKIVRQLQARGLQGDVTVQGGNVQIRAKKEDQKP